MLVRSYVRLVLCLGILCVVAGGVAGVATSTPDSPHDAGVIEIDSEIEEGGEMAVFVSLTESETATSPGELQAHASVSQEPLLSFAETRAGVAVERQFWVTNAALVTVDTNQVALKELAGVEGVESLYRNGEVQVQRPGPGSTDRAGTAVEAAQTNYTYGLEQMSVPTAWNQSGAKGANASVAVLSTGVDADHPDIDVAKWAHFNSTGDPVNSTPNDGTDGFGTHHSGTVTGAENPAGDVPTYGVAPAADLYAVKVLDDDGTGSFAQVIAGIEWAVGENTDVISVNLGGSGYFDSFVSPVRNAIDAGSIVVAQVGNAGEGSSQSPGNVYDAIGIGASNSTGDIAALSAGEQITSDSAWSSPPADWPSQYTVPSVTAPGINVLSATPNSSYDGTFSGTGEATAHAAGVVTLAESALDSDPAPAVVETVLEDTAFKPGDSPAPAGERDTRYGSGIVNASALITALEGLENESFLTLSASAPTVVNQSETLEVNYTTENLGGAEGTESQVNLLVNGSVEDSDTDLTIPANASVNGTLSFTLDGYGGDSVDWTVEMVDNNETTSGSTGVGGGIEPDIVIQSIDAPAVVTPDRNLSVDYTLENLGLENGTESFVDLKVNGTGASFDDTDSNVFVPAGGTASGTLTFDNVSGFFSEGDTINFTVELFDFGDVANGSTDVINPDLQLGSVDAPDTVLTNETLSVDYTIENIASQNLTEGFVDLRIEGTNSEFDDTDEDVTVPAGGTTNGTLTFDNVSGLFDDGDTIEFTVELFDFGDVVGGSTTVDAPEAPVLQLRSIDAPTLVSIDENLTVDYTVENAGNESGTESFVDLLVDGTDATFDDTDQDVTVPAGGTTSGTLTFDNVSSFFDGGDTISYTVELFDFGDSLTGSTVVRQLELQSLSVPAAIQPSENLTVDYTIENVGTTNATESFVNLKVQGTNNNVDDTDQDVTVQAGGTTNGTLTFANVSGFFSEGDTINYTVELFDFSDTLAGSTEVGTPDLQLGSIDGPDLIAPDENLTVNYTIENVGTAVGTEDFVDLKVQGTDATFDDTDVNVTVPAGDTAGGTLVFDNVSGFFSGGDTINYTVELFDFGDVLAGSTDIGAADLQLGSVGTNAPLPEGQNLTVNVTVANVGSISSSPQPVTADAGPIGNASATVQLGPGNATDLSLVIPTPIGQAGNYTVTVSSPDGQTTTEAWVHLPALPGRDIPHDPDGDDLYEDTDGDGLFDIFDVQTIFENLNRPAVQQHKWAYDYDGDGIVDIFDVQTLFKSL